MWQNLHFCFVFEAVLFVEPVFVGCFVFFCFGVCFCIFLSFYCVLIVFDDKENVGGEEEGARGEGAV